MSRRQRVPAEPVADYGAQPWRVDVEDAPDPDRPNATLRRARAYDPLRRLDLDPALFVAAERFRDAYALSQGAREGVGSVRLEPWQRCHYAVKVADARSEVECSLRAVGLRLSGVFVAAVIECQPVRCMERAMRLRSGKGADLIVEALERLRDWQTESGY
jgi:hypothetical protein